MSKPKLYLATDHAGFEYKNTLRDYLIEFNSHGFEVIDLGAFVYDAADDYPDFIARAARRVSRRSNQDRAIIFGGSGQGEAMVANKYSGVRATVFYGGDRSIIELSRKHNNANVLSLGARFIKEGEMIEVVQAWLAIPFSEEPRHIRRLSLLETIERKRFWQRFTFFIRKNNS